jgi:hypothetical protein
VEESGNEAITMVHVGMEMTLRGVEIGTARGATERQKAKEAEKAHERELSHHWVAQKWAS